MKQTLKTIFADFEFWMIAAAAVGAIANAEDKFKLISFSSLTILAMLGLMLFHVRRKLNLKKQKRVPFLVVIGKSENEFRDTLNEVDLALTKYHSDLENLKKAYNLRENNWIYHQDIPLSTKPKDWHNTILKIRERFWELAAELPGRKVYQFIMNAPASLALALGATIGSRNEYIFLHYMAGTGENPYHDVIDFSKEQISAGVRILHTRIDKFEHIQALGLEDLNQSKPVEILVAIHLAGHCPIGDVAKRSKETGLPMIVIQSHFGGTIPLNADWIRIAREVANVLLKVSSQENTERLHLFLSLPLPVAFCVGTALGRFVRATVYNYFPKPGRYFEVFKLEEL